MSPWAISSSGTSSGRNFAGVIHGHRVLTGRRVTMMSPLTAHFLNFRFNGNCIKFIYLPNPCLIVPAVEIAETPAPFVRLAVELRSMVLRASDVVGMSCLGIVMATSELLLLSRPTCDVSGLITAPLYCTKKNPIIIYLIYTNYNDTKMYEEDNSACILAVSPSNNNLKASFLVRLHSTFHTK